MSDFLFIVGTGIAIWWAIDAALRLIEWLSDRAADRDLENWRRND